MFFYFSNKKGAGIFSITSIVIGLLFLLLPDITTSLITNIIGLFLLLQGLGVGVSYLSALKKGRGSIFMALGAFTLIALGVFTITNYQTIISIIPTIVGIFIMFSGINGIHKSFALKNFGDKNWSSSLISAILKLILAFILLTNPFTSAIIMIRVIGLSLIVEAVSSFFTARKYKKFMEENMNSINNLFNPMGFNNNQQNNDGTIDVDYKDVE